ncbi:carbon monoxide dehydrogenase subunit G [Thermoflexus sp.]|uniref:SRPBCC family protein n=1 Tax=Thermoflexus sp. TaxID=1969742 RepID=UPI0035E44047
MRLQGSYRFKTEIARVWGALMNPQVIARLLPGVERLEPVGNDVYEAEMRLGIGPISGRYKARITLSEIDPPNHYRIRIQAQGPQGTVDANGVIDLTAEDGETVMHYEGEAVVTGLLMSMGARLLEPTAQMLVNQGLKNLEAQLGSSS